MKRWTVLVLVLCLCGVSAGAALFPHSKKIYHQGTGTWVKLSSGNKNLGPFDHPHQFSEEAMDRSLAAIRYYRPSLPLLTNKKGSEWDLLTAEERAKIVPYLVQAFAQAGPDQWVDFSIGVYRGGTLLTTYRQSDGVMFVKDGELNIAFRNIALREAPGGPTTPRDATRSYDSPVRIVPGAGQRLMQTAGRNGKEAEHRNWVVMSAVPAAPAPPAPAANSPAPAAGATAPSAPPASSPATVHERLKELKQLYDEGLISREQYEQKRAELLKQL